MTTAPLANESLRFSDMQDVTAARPCHVGKTIVSKCAEKANLARLCVHSVCTVAFV